MSNYCQIATRAAAIVSPIFNRKPGLSRCRISVCAAAVMIAAISVAGAQTAPQPWTLDRAVEQSGLIFEGTVLDVAFRDSGALPGTEATLPHTFVTYRVEDVVRGRPSSRRMTLRFLGGWSSQSGRIAIAFGNPLFKVGDRDVLFVTGNGAAACPLVSCGRGRFRVDDGQVFTDTGVAVRVNANDGLRAGPDRIPPQGLTMEFPPAPEARLRAVRRQLAEDKDLSDADRATLQRRLKDMSGPRVISLGRLIDETPPDPPSTPPLDIAGFKKILAAISERYPTSAKPMPSASLREPIKVYPLTASRPKEPPGPISPPPSQPPTIEQQLLERNNGNPVLGARP